MTLYFLVYFLPPCQRLFFLHLKYAQLEVTNLFFSFLVLHMRFHSILHRKTCALNERSDSSFSTHTIFAATLVTANKPNSTTLQNSKLTALFPTTNYFPVSYVYTTRINVLFPYLFTTFPIPRAVGCHSGRIAPPDSAPSVLDFELGSQHQLSSHSQVQLGTPQHFLFSLYSPDLAHNCTSPSQM